MAQVSITINGFTYSVGCEDGQEPHLLAMAEQVDSRVESIKALGGQSGEEKKLLVLASLLLADELHDLRIELDSLRSLAARTNKPARGEGVKADAELTRKLGRLAIRAEQIAAGLEQP